MIIKISLCSVVVYNRNKRMHKFGNILLFVINITVNEFNCGFNTALLVSYDKHQRARNVMKTCPFRTKQNAVRQEKRMMRGGIPSLQE